jgi:competence ComEA-like helix-hairpin-helix protein
MSGDESTRIDPNTADIEELIQLPGVGEALARRIMNARPFMGIEDMLRVQGVGKATLDRLTSHIAFGEEISIPREAKALRTVKEAPRKTPLSTTPVVADGRTKFNRGAILWLIVGTVLVSVSLSVLLNLAILGGINKTLNIGQHSSVRQMASDIVELQADIDELTSLIRAIDRRIEAVEGLSGRVASVENEFVELHDEITRSLEEINSRLKQIDDLMRKVDLISERVSVFDEFLDGLSQLLMGSSPATEPELTPQP